MSELSLLAREIVRAGRDADEPMPADRARVRRALARAIAGGAVVSAAATAGGQAVLGGVLVKAVVVAAAALMVGGSVGVGVWLGRGRSGVAPPRSAAAGPASPPAVAPAPATAHQPAAPGRSVAQPPRRVSPGERAAPSATPASGADTLEAETRDLREVHWALYAHQPGRALELLAEQAARFPRGELGQEREAARILALCQLGRLAEAGAARARFVRAHPRSPLVPRLRAACALSEAE